MFSIIGVNVSLGTISTMTCVATWFDKYRGIAIGLASVGSAIGNLAGPLVASRLMEVDGTRTEDLSGRMIVRFCRFAIPTTCTVQCASICAHRSLCPFLRCLLKSE